MDEQMQAEQRLKSLSQQTHYITEWVDKKLRGNLAKKRYNETIEEKDEENKQQHVIAKRVSNNRNKNQADDLQKDQKRQLLINQIENHLVHDNLFLNQDHYISPRYRQSDQITNQPMYPHTRGVSSGNIYKVIEDEFIKAKLEFFRRKHTQSQQKIVNFVYQNRSNNKIKPLSLRHKKKKIKQSPFKQRSVQEISTEQMSRLKRIMASQKKISVPQLPKLQMFIPYNYKGRDCL